MNCNVCQNTGQHLCPDIAESILINCSKKGCTYAAARAAYQRLCPYAPKDLPIDKSSTMTAFLEGYKLRDPIIDAANSKIQDLSKALLETESKYLHDKGKKTIYEALQTLFVTCAFRHFLLPSKIYLPRSLIDIFNEECFEKHSAGERKIVVEDGTLQEVTVEFQKDKMIYLGQTLELVEDGR